MDSKLLAIMNERRGEMSYDTLARIIGIQTGTLFKFYKGSRLGVKSLRLVGAWARSNKDNELIQALTDYALGPQ